MIQSVTRIKKLIRLLLVLYLMTWMFGIYVNGYVPMPPFSNAATLLTNPEVATHVLFAVLAAFLSIVLLALGWAYGMGRFTFYSLIASVSIAVGAASGLMFVVGVGDADLDSMLMATGFITAVFLTFLSALSLNSGVFSGGSAAEVRGDRARPAEKKVRYLLVASDLQLALFYLVFLSGMYLNEWVVGATFETPPALIPEALKRLAYSTPFVIHAVLGVLLLTTSASLAAVLGLGGPRKWFLAGGVSAFFVAYSTLAGVLNMTGTVGAGITLPGAPSNYWIAVGVSMLSAAAFMAALIISMLFAIELRGWISWANR